MPKYKLGDKKTNVIYDDWCEVMGVVYTPKNKDKWIEVTVECELQKMTRDFTMGASFLMNPDWMVWGDNNEIWEFVAVKVLSVVEVDPPDLYDLEW